MRMWNINPKVLCSQHLRGEHSECHMLVGLLKRKSKIDGYILNGLLQPRLLFKRHDALAKEMEFRKMTHKSPINHDWSLFDYLTKEQFNTVIDVRKSYGDLLSRCEECRNRAKFMREQLELPTDDVNILLW